MNYKFVLILFLTLIMSGCAGPMNPFGAVNSFKQDEASPKGRSPSSYISSTDALIYFSPGRQNWHDSITFKAKITDKHGVGHWSKVRFFFNDKDITPQFMKNAKKTLSKDGKTLTFAIDSVRLNLDDNNKISVSYQRDDHSSPLIKHYEEPVCPIDTVQKVKDRGVFESKKTTFKTIEDISVEEGINPSLLAGLIAQESAFNSKAISWAKAIGLTQVTSLAEQHVIQKHPDWPRFKNLSSFSYPKVKSLIMMGKINSENEWRLNKELSIKGGIEYLRFVEGYWSIKSNKRLLQNIFPNQPETYEEVVLASYNSGPYRVKMAINRLGQKWLLDRKLVEARKYVRKVKSYCYHFSNSVDSYAPLTASTL